MSKKEHTGPALKHRDKHSYFKPDSFPKNDESFNLDGQPEIERSFNAIVRFNRSSLESKDLLKRLNLKPSSFPKTHKEPLFNAITNNPKHTRTPEFKKARQNEYDDLVQQIEHLYSGILKKEIHDSTTIFPIVQTILKVFSTDKNILLNFCNYDHTNRDYLYAHVLDTTITALNIATAIGYSRVEVIEVGIAALLSDIGMAALSRRFRTSTLHYKSSDIETIHKHPLYSANIIHQLDKLPLSTAIIAYQVHERCNGNGYPEKITKDSIHPFARIIAVADVYSALSSDRGHRPGYRPFEAMKKLISMSQQGWLDMEIIGGLLKYMSLFPIGSIVRLSNNAFAKVIATNPEAASHPIVRIITNNNGEKVMASKYQTANLLHDKNLRIIGTQDNNYLATHIMTGF